MSSLRSVRHLWPGVVGALLSASACADGAMQFCEIEKSHDACAAFIRPSSVVGSDFVLFSPFPGSISGFVRSSDGSFRQLRVQLGNDETLRSWQIAEAKIKNDFGSTDQHGLRAEFVGQWEVVDGVSTLIIEKITAVALQIVPYKIQGVELPPNAPSP